MGSSPSKPKKDKDPSSVKRRLFAKKPNRRSHADGDGDRNTSHKEQNGALPGGDGTLRKSQSEVVIWTDGDKNQPLQNGHVTKSASSSPVLSLKLNNNDKEGSIANSTLTKKSKTKVSNASSKKETLKKSKSASSNSNNHANKPESHVTDSVEHMPGGASDASRRSSAASAYSQQPEVNNNNTSTSTKIGLDYDTGTSLHTSGSSDLLSRLLVRNGLHGRRKNGTVPVWEATRDARRKLSHLCDVTFLPNESLIVTSTEDTRPGLQIFGLGDSGRPGSVLGDSFLASPRGVCVRPEDQVIAATDWQDKTVQFLSMEGHSLGSWKKNKLQHPGGIAVNRSGRYIVADISRREASLGLYSPYGKIFRRFGQESFEWPWYLAVDRRNRLLVSERSCGVISVFDADNGRFLFRFGSQGKGEGQLNSPGGLAVDAQNNIIIADTDNSRVVMHSSDGRFLKTLVNHYSSRPMSVAYEDGFLVVATESDVRLYQTYAEKTSL